MPFAPRLHVPHPPARPGERADFSYLKLSPAGSVARPDPRPQPRRCRTLRRCWCACWARIIARSAHGIHILRRRICRWACDTC